MIVCGGLLAPPKPTLTCCLDLSPAGLIRVVSPFDAVTQSQLRRIKPRGRWNGAGQGWDFPLAAADALQQARSQPLLPAAEHFCRFLEASTGQGRRGPMPVQGR